MTSKVQEAAVKAATMFAKKCEEGLGEILEGAPMGSEGDAIQKLWLATKSAHNLAWAIRNFHLFDPACLSMMRVQQFSGLRPRWSNGSKEAPPYSGGLFVPVFAAVQFGYGRGSAERDPLSGEVRLCGRYVADLSSKNLEANSAALGGQRGQFQISASSPAIPRSVLSRVRPVQDRFELVELIFEAEWGPSVAKDPLVVGLISGAFFLIDQFDLTKMERYVSSEFCRNAEK